MKLRNKKTGEIIDVDFVYPETAEFFYPNFKLVDFNELFEDYEEPKEYWYIEGDGDIHGIRTELCDELEIHTMKQIGNYFDTKEEAEKAVEKLKAWQRLKDKGFRFDGYNSDFEGYWVIYPNDTEGTWCLAQDKADLDLLFGGELCVL